MDSHRWIRALLLVGLLAMQLEAANAQTRIGVAASTKPNAEGVVGGNSQTLLAGSEIYANQTVRTGNRGVADLVFVDRTNLSVGPSSEILLDKFVYDPAGSKGSVVIQATRGAFRFVTGSQRSDVYKISTPYGTLGVRGTVVEMIVQAQTGRKLRPDECAVKVRLVSGTGATYQTSSGKTANLTQPDQVACITPNGDVVYSTSSSSILSFVSADQGPPAGILVAPPVGPSPPSTLPPSTLPPCPDSPTRPCT